MSGVIEVPLAADAQDHGIACVSVLIDSAREVELRAAFFILIPIESFSIAAGGEADIGPVAVEHPEFLVVANHIRRLQAALSLAERGVGMQGDAFRFPIGIGELSA